MATPTPTTSTPTSGADTPAVVFKTLGLALIGLVGLLAFAAVILFHPAWIVPVSLLLTALAMVAIVGTTRM